MQIHELNNFTGALGSGAYLAIDDGNDTGKISSQGLLAATEARIDNIIAGPAPSAEEIVDARLGDDGVTYPSLGDAIRDQVGDLKSDLTKIENDIYYYSTPVAIGDWVTKYIKSDGTYGNSSKEVTSLPQANSFLPKRLVIQALTGYQFYVAEYSSGSFVGFVGNTGGSAQVDSIDFTPVDGHNYGICVSKKDGTSVTPSNIPDNCVAYKYKYYTDKTFTEEGKSADAKAVGDKMLYTDTLIDEVASDDNVIYSSTDIPLTMSTGHYIDIDGNVQSIESTAYAISQTVSVSEGQIYLVHGNSISGNSEFTILDADSNVLQHEVAADSYGHDYRVVVPINASTLIVSGYGNGMSTASLKRINSIGLVASSLGDTKVGYTNFDSLLKASFEVGGYSDVTVTYPNTNYMINAETGALEAISDISASDMIDCSGWVGIRYSGKSFYASCCLAFYQEDGTHILSYPSNGSASHVDYSNEEITIPSNAKYVRFGNNSQQVSQTISIGKASALIPIGQAKMWEGKKWCAVGDSLTEANSRTTKNYHDYIADLTGITVVNMGRSGTGYKRTYDEGYAFYQRISNVPTDSDVVTIFGSGNDMTYVSNSLGDVTDTGTETLCGCINTTIDNLYTIMPTVHLGIITPCPWIDYPPTDLTNPMLKYSEKIVEICKIRGIPCLDLYHCSNLRPWDATFRTLAYSHDDGNGVHPDETGHKLIAGMIKEFVASLFIPV